MHGDDVGLPPSYTIFGRVREGLDVLDKIAGTPVGAGSGGERSRPQREVRLESVTISEKEG